MRDVLPLDAFSRCWVHEGVLFERILPLLPEGKHSSMRQCAKPGARGTSAPSVSPRPAWRPTSSRRRRTRAAVDPRRRGSASSGGLAGRRRAVAALRGRLETATLALIGDLIAAQGPAGRATARLRESLEDFSITERTWLTPQRGAALGGVASGALGGLAADLLAGGLSFGGGVVAGAILGALGGAGLGQGIRLARGERLPFGELVRAVPAGPESPDRAAVSGHRSLRPWAAEATKRSSCPTPGASWWTKPSPPPMRSSPSCGNRPPAMPRRAPDSEARLDRLLADRTRAILAASYPEAAPVLVEPA